MMEEEIVTRFSANRNFVDLVITFSLTIDYGTNKQESDDRRDTDCGVSVLQDTSVEDNIEDQEERGDDTPADGTLPSIHPEGRQLEFDSGGYGGDSPRYSNPLFFNS